LIYQAEKGAFIKWLILGLSLMFGILLAFQKAGLFDLLQKNLQSYLTKVDELPPGTVYDAVYVLGGGQESLRAKFKTLAKIFSQGRCKHIYILSRPGITEYNASLGRNLGNDEWSLMVLQKLGVPESEVQTLNVKDGWFGTLSEARAVAGLARARSWNSLLLVTSPHHTQRVGSSFRHYLKGSEIKVKVKASSYHVGLFELLNEMLKIKVYQNILLN